MLSFVTAVAAGSGDLTLTGVFNLYPTDPVATVYANPPIALAPVTYVNDTRLAAVTTPADAMWSDALITVRAGGYNVSLRKSRLPISPPPTVTPPTVSYGAAIVITAPYVGTMVPTALMLSTPSGGMTVNCSGLVVLNDTSVTCTPWLLPSAAFGVPLSLSVLLPNSLSPAPLTGASVTVTLPRLSILPAINTATAPSAHVPVRLSAPMPPPAAWAPSSPPPRWTTLTTYLRAKTPTGAVAAVVQRSTGSLLACAAPALADGAVLVMRANLSMFAAAASGRDSVSFAPPTLGAVIPTTLPALLLPGPPAQNLTTPPDTPLLLVGTLFGSAAAPRLQRVEIGGVPCASVTVLNATTAVCLGWEWRCAPGSGVMRLPVTLVWRGGRVAVRPPTRTVSVQVVIGPTLKAVSPALVEPGMTLTLSGAWFDVASLVPACGGPCRAAVTASVGGVPCANLTLAATGTATCIVPPGSLAAPGYPVLPVTLVSSASVPSAATGVTVTYVSALTTAWASLPPSPSAPTCLLPAGRLAGGVVPWPVPIALHVAGIGSGNCWLELVDVQVPPPLSPNASNNYVGVGLPAIADVASVSLVGAPQLRVELTPVAPAATLNLSGVGIYGDCGTRLALAATCMDSRGKASAPATTWPVVLATLRGAWNASALAAALTAHPLGLDPLPPLPFTLTWDGVAAPLTAAAWMSCIAGVWPAAALAAADPEGVATEPPTTAPLTAYVDVAPVTTAAHHLASNNGTGGGGGACPDGGAQTLATCWDATFDALTLAYGTLATSYVLAAECVWTPTGERVRLESVHFTTATAAVNWTVAAHDSTTGQQLLALFLSEPVRVPAVIDHNVPLAEWPAAQPSCRLVTTSTGHLRLAADAASATYDVTPSGALVPDVVVAVEGTPGETIDVALVCTLWGEALTSAPVTLRAKTIAVAPAAPRPTHFLPTDGGTPTLTLDPPPAFRAVDSTGAPVAGLACTLASATNGADLRRADGTPTVSLVTDADGMAVASAVVVVATFSVPTMEAVLACVRPTDDAPPPLVWRMDLTAMALRVCVPPPAVTTDGGALHSWSLSIDVDGGSGCNTSAPIEPLRAEAAAAVVCAMVVEAQDAAERDDDAADTPAYLEHGTVLGADVATGGVAFDNVALIGVRGRSYNTTASCTLAGVTIPGVARFAVEMLRCPAGSASTGLVCNACPTGTYTRGDNEPACLPCPPIGAVCTRGILALLPGYYRPPSSTGLVGPDTPLYPCFNSAACELNVSTADGGAEVYSCATGYMGPRCGECDRAAGFVMSGDACAPCWPATSTWALLAGIVVLFSAFLASVGLSPAMQAHDDSNIALKLLLGFVQALASLRVFAASGTALFRNLLGWAEGVSASPLSSGALQCQLGWGLLTRYTATVALPGVALVGCVALVAAYYAAATCCCLRCRPRVWVAALKAWAGRRRHTAALVFMMFLCYMPIVSASFEVLDCYPRAIDGAYWLQSDYGVRCYVGQHALTSILAVVVLVVVGAGFPVGLYALLSSATAADLAEPAFHDAYAFLYEGYRNELQPLGLAEGRRATARRRALVTMAPTAVPDAIGSSTGAALLPAPAPAGAVICVRLRRVVRSDTLAWWEAAVLLRKAGVVMLASVITNPFYQVVGAVLWFAGAIFVQQHFSPYVRPLFNGLELAVLVDLYVTAAVSTILLPSAVSGSASALSSTWTTAYTGVLLLINLGTGVLLIAVLAATLLHYLRRTLRGSPPGRAGAAMTAGSDVVKIPKSVPRATVGALLPPSAAAFAVAVATGAGVSATGTTATPASASVGDIPAAGTASGTGTVTRVRARAVDAFADGDVGVPVASMKPRRMTRGSRVASFMPTSVSSTSAASSSMSSYAGRRL